MRVVLDTNVIVSSTIVPNGKSAIILKHLEERAFELLISDQLLAECRRVLGYPRVRKRHRYTDEQIEGVLKSIRRLSTIVTPGFTLEAVAADRDDNRVIECAVAGGADYIVSGDMHLLSLQEYRGIQILPPADFLLVLSQSDVS